MSNLAIEQLLAKLYTDSALCAKFVRNPREVALDFGLAEELADKAALIDKQELIMAARSFAKKRVGKNARKRSILKKVLGLC